jgi:hypothetical protein
MECGFLKEQLKSKKGWMNYVFKRDREASHRLDNHLGFFMV